MSQAQTQAETMARKGKPNILVIMGDDIGYSNVSIHTAGIQGFITANIDRIGREGAIFSHAYGQNSCTAGRIAFVSGQCPFRVGMTAIGFAGSPDGIPDWVPTVADLLKMEGYNTGQFGKNHFGDMNAHLPTLHGFDEFYGALYHLNTSDEPEHSEYPPEKEFFEKYGPRGVMDCVALDRDPIGGDGGRFGPVGKQKITDTGPLTMKRMETYDEECLERTTKFIENSVRSKTPFFAWHNPSRMHVWTRLQEKYKGISGAGLYGDGMVEHDGHVGQLLDLLEKLKIDDNTIVIYTTDNGVEKASWPDGGSAPWHGEKGSTEEGGFRIPFLMKWPGVIEPGTYVNTIFSLEDCLPTLLEAAGHPGIAEEIKSGNKIKAKRLDDRFFHAHIDGVSWVPYFLQGKRKDVPPPRESFIYFGQNGDLQAVRWKRYKASFTRTEGNIFLGFTASPQAPTLFDLYADPYQVMDVEGGSYNYWYGERMFIFPKFGEVMAAFMDSLAKYPNNFISSYKPQNLNYDTAKLLTGQTAVMSAEEMQAVQLAHANAFREVMTNHRKMFRDPFQ